MRRCVVASLRRCVVASLRRSPSPAPHCPNADCSFHQCELYVAVLLTHLHSCPLSLVTSDSRVLDRSLSSCPLELVFDSPQLLRTRCAFPRQYASCAPPSVSRHASTLRCRCPLGVPPTLMCIPALLDPAPIEEDPRGSNTLVASTRRQRCFRRVGSFDPVSGFQETEFSLKLYHFFRVHQEASRVT
jgi:hypothetical protein